MSHTHPPTGLAHRNLTALRIVTAMRVVSGELGGRRIVAPEGTSTRPTTDRVREAIFNALGSRGIVEDALVADLFAGSGGLGIEALSRGAEHCTFVERDRAALAALRENLATLDLDDRSRVVAGNAQTSAAHLDVDLVLADPPYDFDAWPELLSVVRADTVVAESGQPLMDIAGWDAWRSKRYGRTWVTFLERDR
ncbi:MAG: 16S rRNA (guanine(966)-N(2))-methyltransferase RsmD [Actinomycetota bacterium]